MQSKRHASAPGAGLAWRPPNRDARVLDIIDVGGLRTGDPAAVVRVAAQVGRACRDTGFFYVRNHGIPDGLMAGIFASANE